MLFRFQETEGVQETSQVNESRSTVHRSAYIEKKERLSVLIKLYWIFYNRIKTHDVARCVQTVNAQHCFQAIDHFQILRH